MTCTQAAPQAPMVVSYVPSKQPSDNEAKSCPLGRGLSENSISGALFTVLLTPCFVQPGGPAEWVSGLQPQGF